jgi:hypothetical protein
MPPRSFILKLLGITFISMLPLWFILDFKWPISSDVIFYATILKTFSAQLWSGDVYPRWLSDTNGGYGSSVFLFYAPLPYYVLSIFEFLSSIDPYGFGRLWIGLTIGLFISGITSYCWLKCLIPETQAQKGALLYVGFPYLFVITYTFFGLSQLWAYALMPLLLHAAHDITKKGWRALPLWIASYGLMAYTHLISTLIFAGIPWLYVVCFSNKKEQLRNAIISGLGVIAGIAIAAWYIVPALINKAYIVVAGFTYDSRFYVSTFFEVHAVIATLVIILPLLGFYIELPAAMRKNVSAHVRFWLVVIMGLFFITTPLSKPLWDSIPQMQYFQGTFRFFMPMIPGVVFISIYWMAHIKTQLLYPAFFVFGLITSTLYSSHTLFFDTIKPIEKRVEHRLIVVPEYQTIWMQRDNIDFQEHIPEEFINLPLATITKGLGKTEVISQSSRHITLHTDITSGNATITLKRFYFPGWVSDKINIKIIESGAMLAVQAPKGTHEITLTIPWFEGEKAGFFISLSTLMLLLGIFLASRLKPVGFSDRLPQP